jgi:hypothetical protein
MTGTARRRAARYPNRIPPSLYVVLTAALVAVMASRGVHADDPVSTNVSFNREIIRIIQRKCEPCHAAGGLAFSLSDYRDARAWGRAIREELVEHRMPPAIIARGYGDYESDPSLNTREMATFLTWLDGGMPRGDEADRPPKLDTVDPAGDDRTGASVRFALPPQQVPACEELVIRRVTIDAGPAAGRPIARVELRPGNRRVLRGATIFAASGASASTWIGSWSPWQHAVVPPTSHAFRLPTPGTVIVDLYYRGSDSEVTDRSELDVIFASGSAQGGIEDLVVHGVTDASASRVRGSLRLSHATTIWAVHPEFDGSAASMELRAERPDKSLDVLFWIPKASAEWPVSLVMEKPVSLPAGTTLSLVVETKRPPGPASRPSVTLSVLSNGR